MLDQFKDEYRRKPSATLWGVMFREVILIEMFNFWTDDGKIPITKEEQDTRGKVCKSLYSKCQQSMRNTLVFWPLDCKQLADTRSGEAHTDLDTANDLH